MQLKTAFTLLAVLFSTIFTYSCTSTPEPQQSAEEIIKQRSEARWALMIEGRLESAYKYLTPTYREVTPYSHYARKIKNVGIWEKASVEQVTCEQETCLARVRIWTVTYHPLLKDPIRADGYIDETWIKRDNFDNWYLKPNL